MWNNDLWKNKQHKKTKIKVLEARMQPLKEMQLNGMEIDMIVLKVINVRKLTTIVDRSTLFKENHVSF